MEKNSFPRPKYIMKLFEKKFNKSNKITLKSMDEREILPPAINFLQYSIGFCIRAEKADFRL